MENFRQNFLSVMRSSIVGVVVVIIIIIIIRIIIT